MRRLRRVEATTPRPLTRDEAKEVLHLGAMSTEAALQMPSVISADSPIAGSEERLLLDAIQGDASNIPEFRLNEVELWEVLHSCPNITERDRTIMGMYAFGSKFAEIAAELGLSRERVRQIVTVTTSRLRAFVAK